MNSTSDVTSQGKIKNLINEYPIEDATIVEDNTSSSSMSKKLTKETTSTDSFDLFADVENKNVDILVADVVEGQVQDTSIVKVYERSILTSGGMSLGGQRLLRVVLSLITPQDRAGKRYSFNVNDYKEVFRIVEYPIEQLKSSAQELLAPRQWKTSDSEDELAMSGLISDIHVKDGIATFSIAPHLLPIYQSMREKNQYLLGYIKDFDCSYSFSFYELFLEKLGSNTENPNSVTIFYSIDKLREWLRLGNKYVDNRTGKFSITSFRRKILQPMLNDINKKNEGGSLCNINVEMREIKQGRSYVGIEFTIWRTSSVVKEQPIVNEFYTKLRADTKLAYDALIAMNIKQKEIETCIIVNGEDKYIEVCHYIAKLKYKGRAYVSSILRNCFTEFDPTQKMNINNIHKAYNLEDADKQRYDDAEAAIRAANASDQIIVNSVVKKALLEYEPYIYKYIDNMNIIQILDTKDIKIFFLEMFIDILAKKKSKDLIRIYQAYFESKEKTGILAATSSKVTELFEQYGVNKTVWPSLVSYPEDYILANINYCIEKYRKGKGQKDIAGAIVKAIKQDYASFNVSKKEDELEKAKREFSNSIYSQMDNLFEDNSTKESATAADKNLDEYDGEDKPKNSSSSISPEVEIEKAYRIFIKKGTEEDKNRLKMAALRKMSDFQKSIIASNLEEGKHFTIDEMAELPVEKLITSIFFDRALQRAFAEEMGF